MTTPATTLDHAARLIGATPTGQPGELSHCGQPMERIADARHTCQVCGVRLQTTGSDHRTPRPEHQDLWTIHQTR